MIISDDNIDLMMNALLEGNIINRENGRKVLKYILNRSNEGFKLSWALSVARRYIGNFDLTDPITVGEETINVIEETSHEVNEYE